MITGTQLKDAILSASNHIHNNRKQVDELNIFPVPDGDTGTNMSMTIGAAAKELSGFASDSSENVPIRPRPPCSGAPGAIPALFCLFCSAALLRVSRTKRRPTGSIWQTPCFWVWRPLTRRS